MYPNLSLTTGPAVDARDASACSCGCTAPHPIATRETADGRRVLVLSDGAIIDGPSKFSPVLRGLGAPRSRYARELRARAVRLLLDSFDVLDHAEIAKAIKLAERGFRMRFVDERSHRAFVFRSLGGAA